VHWFQKWDWWWSICYRCKRHPALGWNATREAFMNVNAFRPSHGRAITRRSVFSALRHQSSGRPRRGDSLRRVYCSSISAPSRAVESVPPERFPLPYNDEPPVGSVPWHSGAPVFPSFFSFFREQNGTSVPRNVQDISNLCKVHFCSSENRLHACIKYTICSKYVTRMGTR